MGGTIVDKIFHYRHYWQSHKFFEACVKVFTSNANETHYPIYQICHSKCKMHNLKKQILIIHCFVGRIFLSQMYAFFGVKFPSLNKLTSLDAPISFCWTSSSFVNFFYTDLSANLAGCSQMIACIIQYLIQYNVIFSESIFDDSNLLTWGHKL